jgi:hypothetical protein
LGLHSWFYEEARRGPALGRYAPRMPKFVPSLVLLLVSAALVGWLIFFGFALLGGASGWPWRPHFDRVSQDKLSEAVKSAVTALGVIGGVFAVVYAYRKQRIDEADGHRSDAEQLSKRYQDAAEQLGHDKAAVRLAGVYTLARLADEWPEQRQVCIDVLCAYLRLPITDDDDHEIHVRHAIYAVMREHLDGSTTSWSDLRFDFNGALLLNFNLDGAVFNHRVNFRAASFLGNCSFASATFLHGAEFTKARIKGRLSLVSVKVKQGFLDLNDVEVIKGSLSVYVSEVDDIARLLIAFSKISSGELTLRVLEATTPWEVAINHLTVEGGSKVVIAKQFTTLPTEGSLPKIEAHAWDVLGGELIFDEALRNYIDWRPRVE